MSNLLNNGTSGLLAFQRAIATTSHNIANAETEGYSRQRVELQSLPPQHIRPGAVGNGVQVVNTERLADQFANQRLVTATSERARQSAHLGMARQLDGFVATDALNLTPVINDYFAALQDANADPASIAAREVLLAKSDQLADRFRTLLTRFEETRKESNQRIAASVDEINTIAANIANLNSRIAGHTGSGGSQSHNDLLDQREQLLGELAEQVDINTLSDGGVLNVTIGNGLPLVMGDEHQTLRVVSNPDPDNRISIEFGKRDHWQPVHSQLTGGLIGGLQEFDRDTLTPAEWELGRLAISMSRELNDQHAAGIDLEGNPGGKLFSVSDPITTARELNGGNATISAEVDDASALLATDYSVVYDGSDYVVTRDSDGTSFTTGLPASFDGLSISVSGSASAGDQFTISATRRAASGMQALLSDPKHIALADANEAGNNENGLLLADLQIKQSIEGVSSFNDSYGKLVSHIGGATSVLATRSEAMDAVYRDAEERRLSVSGVNLDEEAVNLTRYEQAYQAAAQVIATADSLFDTLLGAVAQ